MVQVNVGEPAFPVAFGGRGKRSILPTVVDAVAGDHDFHVVSLTPSVTLAVGVKPDEGQDMVSYYRGMCKRDLELLICFSSLVVTLSQAHLFL